MTETNQPASSCQLATALGPEADLVAACGATAFAWRPRAFASDIEPQLARLTCATDVKGSALETIRRCYVSR